MRSEKPMAARVATTVANTVAYTRASNGIPVSETMAGLTTMM
jgi:hypothetical protein